MSDDDLETVRADSARAVMGWSAADIPWAYDGVTPVWHTSDGRPRHDRVFVAARPQ